MKFWQRLKLGIKKLGPTAKVMLWMTGIGLFLALIGLLLALGNTYLGATKSNQDKIEKMLSAQGENIEKKLSAINQKFDESVAEESDQSKTVKKTLEQREKDLKDAIYLLKDAISQVDNGNFQYFKVISAQLRGLIGTGYRKSNPLLLNLAEEKGIKLECYAYSIAGHKELEPSLVFSMPLNSVISVTPVSGRGIEKWEFKKWLETLVTVFLGDLYTPNEVIRLMAEKEGGAHYDDALPEKLLKLTGFTYHINGGQYNQTDKMLYQIAVAVVYYGDKILETKNK